MAGNTRDIIQRYVWLFGQWEVAATAWLTDTLRPGDGFVDVGANVGYYTLLAAAMVRGGPVIAIEPSAMAAEALGRSLGLNPYSNVRVLKLAASAAPTSLELHPGSSENSGLASTTSAQAEGQVSIVDGLPLADILTPSDLASTRVVKIDVEGGELGVVRGLLPVIDRARPELELIVEVAPDLMHSIGQDPNELLGLLGGAGFHPYRLENDYRPESYVGPPRRPERFDGPILAETDLVFSRRDVAEL